MLKILMLANLMFFGSGCVSFKAHMADVAHGMAGHTGPLAKTRASLDSKVGKVSYDDMLKKAGAPAQRVDGDAVFIAAWPYGNGMLHLTFDRQTKTMQGWRWIDGPASTVTAEAPQPVTTYCRRTLTGNLSCESR